MTGWKPEDDETKVGRYYINGLLGFVFNVIISIIKSINSLIKIKVSKYFFLTNYQIIYLISPEINYNNNLLF